MRPVFTSDKFDVSDDNASSPLFRLYYKNSDCGLPVIEDRSYNNVQTQTFNNVLEGSVLYYFSFASAFSFVYCTETTQFLRSFAVG